MDETSFYAILKSKSDSRLVPRECEDVQDNVVLEKVLKHLKTYLGEIKTDPCRPHERRLVQKHINRGKRIDKFSPQCDRNYFNYVENNKAQNWPSGIRKPAKLKPLFNRSFTSCSCMTFTNTNEYQRNIPKYDRNQDPYCKDANRDTENSYYRPSTPSPPKNFDRKSVEEKQFQNIGTVGDNDNDIVFKKEKPILPIRDDDITSNRKNKFTINRIQNYDEVKYHDTGDHFLDDAYCKQKHKSPNENSCRKNSATFCHKRTNQKSVHPMTNHRSSRRASHCQKSIVQSKRSSCTRQLAAYNNQGPQFVINNRRLSKQIQNGRHNESKKNTKHIIETRIPETARKPEHGSVQNRNSRVSPKTGKDTKVEIRSSDLIKPIDKLLRLCDSCEKNPCSVHDTLVLSDMIRSFLKVMNNSLFANKSTESVELRNINALERMKNILLMASQTKEIKHSLSMIKQKQQMPSKADTFRFETHHELNETTTSDHDRLSTYDSSKSNLQIQNVTKTRATDKFSVTSPSNQLITTYRDEYQEKQENHGIRLHKSKSYVIKSSDEQKNSPLATLDDLPLKSQVAYYLRTLRANEDISKSDELYSTNMQEETASISNEYHENQKGSAVSLHRHNDNTIQRTDYKCFSQLSNTDQNENFKRQMLKNYGDATKYEATPEPTPMNFRNIDMPERPCVYRSDYPYSYFSNQPLEHQLVIDNAFCRRGDSGEQSFVTEFPSKPSSQHNFRRSFHNRTDHRFKNEDEEDTEPANDNISEYVMNAQTLRNERHHNPTPVYRITNDRFYNSISIQSTPGIYNQKKIQTTLMPKTDAKCQHNPHGVSVLNVFAQNCKPFFKINKKEGLFNKVKKISLNLVCGKQPKILFPSRRGTSTFGVEETNTVQHSVCFTGEIRDKRQNKKTQTAECSTDDFNKSVPLQNINEIGIQSIIDINPMTFDKDVYKIENADCYVQTKFKSRSRKIQIPDQDKYLITPKSVQVSRCEIVDQGVNVLIEPTVFTVNNKNTKQFFRKCLSKYQALKRPLHHLQDSGIHFSCDSLEITNDSEKPQKLTRFMDAPSHESTEFEVYQPQPTRQLPYLTAASGDIRIRQPFEEEDYIENHSLRRMNSFDFYNDDSEHIINRMGPRYDIPSHTRYYEQPRPINIDYINSIPKDIPQSSQQRSLDPKPINNGQRTKEHHKCWYKNIRLRRRPRSKQKKIESNSVNFSAEAEVMPFYDHKTLKDQYRPQEYTDQMLHPGNGPRFGYHMNTVSLDRNFCTDSLENADIEEEESPKTIEPPKKFKPFQDRSILFI